MNLLLAGFDLFLVFVVVALCISVGRLATSRLFSVSLDAREEILCSLGLGIGTVGTAILLVGLVGLAGRLAQSLLLVGLAILTRHELATLPSRTAQAFRETTADWSRLELGITGLIAAFVIVHAALPVTNYDSLVYHIGIPDQYVREGRIFFTPNNLSSAYVGVFHMLYVPLLSFGTSAAPALFNGAITIALIPLVHVLGERLWDRETARLAAMLIWAGPVLILVGVTPRTDVALVWFLLLAHYFIIRALSESGKADCLWIGAVLLGIAFSVKANALLYVLGLSPLLVWAIHSEIDQWWSGPRVITAVGALILVPALPWLIRNWIWFGDPLYPRLFGHIAPTWLMDIYDGQVQLLAATPTAMQQVRVPFNLSDFFFAPQRLTPEGEGILYFANPVLFLLPLTFLDERWKSKFWLATPALIYGWALLILQSEGTNLRYLIPAVLPLTIVAVAGLRKVLSYEIQRIATLLLLLPLAISLTLLSAAQLTWPYFFGGISADQYAATLSNGEFRELLNNEIPREALVLMLFDGRVYGIEPSVIPDHPGANNWLPMAAAAADGCLEGSEITHVVVNDHLREYLESRSLDPESIRWDEFASFEERCLDRQRERGWYRLYQIRPAANRMPPSTDD